MQQSSGIGDWLEGQRSRGKTWLMALICALGLLVVANFFVHPEGGDHHAAYATSVFMEIDHPHFVYDAYPAFWAVFGLGVALLMTVILKKIVFPILGRPEDLYDADE